MNTLEYIDSRTGGEKRWSTLERSVTDQGPCLVVYALIGRVSKNVSELHQNFEDFRRKKRTIKGLVWCILEFNALPHIL